MRRSEVLLIGACSLVLAGCAGHIPELTALPPTEAPANFELSASGNAPIWPTADWWRSFDSAELDRLIAAAQSENLDLAAAQARVLQADARVRQAGANLLPTLGINADAREVKNGGGFGVSFGAAYEFDFWGRNRNVLAATEAVRRATLADRETVALTATAATATTYFQILSFRERLDIARLNLESALAVLTITEARVRGGVATPLDLAQQRAQIAGLQSVIPALEQQALQTRIALALLLGRPPEGFQVAASDIMGVTVPEVGPGLPAELLTRRPDVVAVEASLEAAHASVAVARAAFFPSISLTGSGGLASPALTGLIANPAMTYAFGVSLAQAIFDGGALTAQSDEARARELELVANYRQAAITAFSEVETSLGAIANLAAQAEFQAEQVRQAEQAFSIAQIRYREGVSDFLAVLDAQRTLYSTRDQLGLVRLARLQAAVALYRALGGGWSDPGPSSLARQ